MNEVFYGKMRENGCANKFLEVAKICPRLPFNVKVLF